MGIFQNLHIFNGGIHFVWMEKIVDTPPKFNIAPKKGLFQ